MNSEQPMTPSPDTYTKLFHTVLKVFLTLVVPVLLTIFSIRLVMSYEFLQFEYLRPDFPIDYYGFNTDDRLTYAPYAIDYLLNGEDISYLRELRLPLEKCWQPLRNATDCPMYEEAALKHMVDVKIVTETAFIVGFVLTFIMLGILVAGYRYTQFRKTIRQGLTYGSMFTLGLIITIIVLAFTAWDYFFDTFHELFFEEGTWRFAFSDTLIRLYPERFWFDASITIGILTTAGAILILALVWYWHRQGP